MSSQPRLRSQRALATAPLRRSSSQWRTRAAAVTIATALAFLTFTTASLATIGSVYFDTNGNAAAGGTLFNGTFSGTGNVGLGQERDDLSHVRQRQFGDRGRSTRRRHQRQRQHRQRLPGALQ